MIIFASIGMFFKVASWVIGFIFLAKGESKMYFWNELIKNIYYLIFSLWGYYMCGLKGLGIAMTATYLVYFIQVVLMTKYKFNFILSPSFKEIFVIQFILAVITFVILRSLPNPYSLILSILFILSSTLLSIFHLNKKINIIELIIALKRKMI